MNEINIETLMPVSISITENLTPDIFRKKEDIKNIYFDFHLVKSSLPKYQSLLDQNS